MQTLTLDGSSFSTLDGFFEAAYRLLTRGLDWTPAHNLDALNDILYGGFGVYAGRERIRLVWAHNAKSRVDLGYPETVRYWEQKVRTFHPSNRPYAEGKLAAARAGTGQTLYGLLVEIITDHPNIELVEQ